MNTPRHIAAALLCLPALSAMAATAYDVAAIGDMTFTGQALNEAGAVLASDYRSNWLYQNGVLQDLGRFGSSGWVAAHDLNDRGIVFGGRTSASGVEEAFMSDHGIVTAIPGMSIAMHANNAGQVVGLTADHLHPVLWTGAALESISFCSRSQYLQANAINAAGQVVGQRTNTGPNLAFVYGSGVITPIDLPGEGYAADINDLGQVVGWACTGNACRGYLYADGTARFMALPPQLTGTWFTDINNHGDIVGNGYDRNGRQTAFLLDAAGYTMLNDVLDPDSAAQGWKVLSITDFNEAGQMLAVATRNGYWNETVLLTPMAGVPEPAVWQLWMWAALAAGGVHRLRRPAAADPRCPGGIR